METVPPIVPPLCSITDNGSCNGHTQYKWLHSHKKIVKPCACTRPCDSHVFTKEYSWYQQSKFLTFAKPMSLGHHLMVSNTVPFGALFWCPCAKGHWFCLSFGGGHFAIRELFWCLFLLKRAPFSKQFPKGTVLALFFVSVKLVIF